jgi:hypothetical protein
MPKRTLADRILGEVLALRRPRRLLSETDADATSLLSR